MDYPKSLFVGNIPYDYDEESLKETLSLVGPVKFFEIKSDEKTKKPKGYGFCEYKKLKNQKDMGFVNM